MKKPRFISHFLVLDDLLKNVDVRIKSDIIHYLTSRIENIKVDLVNSGVLFVDDIRKESRYSTYKPYILLPTAENLDKAKELLKVYATDEVMQFLENKPHIEDKI
jgi:hypothetical protein